MYDNKIWLAEAESAVKDDLYTLYIYMYLFNLLIYLCVNWIISYFQICFFFIILVSIIVNKL